MNRRLVIGSVLLLVMATAFGLWRIVRPAYRRHKEHVAIERAEKFFVGGDLRNASLCARQALLANPVSLKACQIMAELSEFARAPQVLDWRRRIAEIEPTSDNKLRLASTALRIEPPPFPIASQTLSELAVSATNLASYHVIAAELAVKLKRFPEAESQFLAATRLEPTNDLHHLNFSVLRLHSTNPLVADQARATLERLRCHNQLAPIALRWLIEDNLSRKDWIAAERLSQALLAGPGANLDDRLQHLDILRQAGRPELQTWLESFQARFATNANNIYALAAWMNSHKIPPVPWLKGLSPTLQTELPVLIALAEAYLVAKDWIGLENLLQDQKWGEQEFRRLALLSRAASEQKRTMAADAHWRLAVRQAGDRLGPLNWLLAAAADWGRTDARDLLLWQIAQKFPRERWSWQELQRSYEAAGNTAGLNKVYSALMLSAPTDFIAQNNFAATALLLKINLVKAHQVARDTYARHPEEPIVVSTYAYSLHLQNRTREGLATLEKICPAALQHPAVALYYGVLLQADSQSNKAAKFFALVNPTTLLPEEKALMPGT